MSHRHRLLALRGSSGKGVDHTITLLKDEEVEEMAEANVQKWQIPGVRGYRLHLHSTKLPSAQPTLSGQFGVICWMMTTKECALRQANYVHVSDRCHSVASARRRLSREEISGAFCRGVNIIISININSNNLPTFPSPSEKQMNGAQISEEMNESRL
uniref:Uncharacterized protein n=1 Tax=Globodera rostochiensis TaxID=31243 RepID=A0A914IBW3_GLORO